jgi:hypothetical protein
LHGREAKQCDQQIHFRPTMLPELESGGENPRFETNATRRPHLKAASRALKNLDQVDTRTFSTWGNSGIEPDKGTGNQLSKNGWGQLHVASQ